MGPQRKESRVVVRGQWIHPIFVPPGTNTPLIISPCGGASFSINPVTGGQILKPSLMHACRYGSCLASASRIGDEIFWRAIAVSISDRSFENTVGVLIR